MGSDFDGSFPIISESTSPRRVPPAKRAVSPAPTPPGWYRYPGTTSLRWWTGRGWAPYWQNHRQASSGMVIHNTVKALFYLAVPIYPLIRVVLTGRWWY